MKKTLISFAVAAAALTSVALAGGPVVQQPSETGVYIEGMVGGGYHVNHKFLFSDDSPYGPYFGPSYWSHTSWSWTLGADIGYQFNRYLSAELGGFWLQKTEAKKDNPGFGPERKNLWFQNWLGYIAAKMTIPVMDNFDLFAKAGVGVNHWRWGKDWNDQDFTKRSFNGFGPVFAVGGSYKFGADHNAAVSLQYMRFGQSWSTYNDQNTNFDWAYNRSLNAIDLLTVGVSYRFQM